MRKYRLKGIISFYVSSSYSAYLEMHVNVFDKANKMKYWYRIQLCLPEEFTHMNTKKMSWFNPPKYLIKEIKEELKLSKCKYGFYEYDQDGNRRTEELKYTDKEKIKAEFLAYANS